MRRRFPNGRRVTIAFGERAGLRGTIDGRFVTRVWVRLDEPLHEGWAWLPWVLAYEYELKPYTVPAAGRPKSVGALQDPSRRHR